MFSFVYILNSAHKHFSISLEEEKISYKKQFNKYFSKYATNFYCLFFGLVFFEMCLSYTRRNESTYEGEVPQLVITSSQETQKSPEN